jgi:hypothetical protein
MAIPSGGGSEVLKVVYEEALTNSDTTLFTTSSTQIVTSVSVIFTEAGGADGNEIDLWIDAARNDANGASGTDIKLIHNVVLTSKQTFVFSDKFVFYGGDALKCAAASSDNIDVVFSFILQDWT